MAVLVAINVTVNYVIILLLDMACVINGPFDTKTIYSCSTIFYSEGTVKCDIYTINNGIVVLFISTVRVP